MTVSERSETAHPPHLANGNGSLHNPIANGNHAAEGSANSARPAFELEEHPIGGGRPSIKVGVIGAGLAGVTAGVLLPAKVPGLDLRIYDKNADAVCVIFLSCPC